MQHWLTRCCSMTLQWLIFSLPDPACSTIINVKTVSAVADVQVAYVGKRDSYVCNAETTCEVRRDG
jgi:hypothetical protein